MSRSSYCIDREPQEEHCQQAISSPSSTDSSSKWSKVSTMSRRYCTALQTKYHFRWLPGAPDVDVLELTRSRSARNRPLAAQPPRLEQERRYASGRRGSGGRALRHTKGWRRLRCCGCIAVATLLKPCCGRMAMAALLWRHRHVCVLGPPRRGHHAATTPPCPVIPHKGRLWRKWTGRRHQGRERPMHRDRWQGTCTGSPPPRCPRGHDEPPNVDYAEHEVVIVRKHLVHAATCVRVGACNSPRCLAASICAKYASVRAVMTGAATWNALYVV